MHVDFFMQFVIQVCLWNTDYKWNYIPLYVPSILIRLISGPQIVQWWQEYKEIPVWWVLCQMNFFHQNNQNKSFWIWIIFEGATMETEFSPLQILNMCSSTESYLQSYFIRCLFCRAFCLFICLFLFFETNPNCVSNCLFSHPQLYFIDHRHDPSPNPRQKNFLR